MEQLHSLDRGDKPVAPHDRQIINAAVPLGKMEPVQTYDGTSPSRNVAVSNSNRSHSSDYRNKLDEYYMQVKDGMLTEQRYETWARAGFCPECECETIIPHNDYLCIKCRLDNE